MRDAVGRRAITLWSGCLLLTVALLCLAAPARAGGDLRWSPDGRWLAFVTRSPVRERVESWIWHTYDRIAEDLFLPAGRGGWHLWICSSDGKQTLLIHSGNEPLASPAWHPTGHRLAYARREGDAWVVAIVEQGEQVQTVARLPRLPLAASTAGLGGSLDWSPDGRYLAVEADGQVTVLSSSDGSVSAVLPHSQLPRWSPRGGHLAVFSRWPRKGLAVADVPGFALRMVLETETVTVPPHWGTDGSSLVLVRTAREPANQRGQLAWTSEVAEVWLQGTQLDLLHRPELGRQLDDRPATLWFALAPNRELLHLVIPGGNDDTLLEMVEPVTRDLVRRWHPLDSALAVGQLSLSPDGQQLALRYGSTDETGCVATIDLNTRQRRLLFGNAAGRQLASWHLANAYEQALIDDARVTLLPELRGTPAPCERISRLPTPVRLRMIHAIYQRRLDRLLEFAGLLQQPEARTAGESNCDVLFEFARGHHDDALSLVARLEQQAKTRIGRLRWLALRGQLLAAAGREGQAQALLEDAAARIRAAAQREPVGPAQQQLAALLAAVERFQLDLASGADAKKYAPRPSAPGGRF